MLVAAVFLASAVEMVEALTIVLAVGVTRGWRSAARGGGGRPGRPGRPGGGLGPALVHYVPLSALRLVVGALLLVFGLQWLRKAVLRAAGLKAKHDEDAIFAEQVAELSDGGRRRPGRDATAFTVAFKGVFLEGLEVVVIVLTLGTTVAPAGLAAVAAAAAVVVVGVVGLVVAPPAVRGARERHEDGRRPHAGELRHLLGGRGRRRPLARLRPGRPGAGGLVYGLVAWLLVTRCARRRRSGRPDRPTGEASHG